jgi:DNA polymerase III sliding clamp (beta) subunit (PCNA family)
VCSSDLSSINLDQTQFSNLISTFSGNKRNDDFEPYKEFKFKIKEEQTLGAQQAQVVKGNKRRYAVAVNRDGTEVLKSDFSFTLDPNDLIEQLKLVIDQRNLQG